jgi:hypothetical protein
MYKYDNLYFAYLPNTKDIWAKDYMPIQVLEDNLFISLTICKALNGEKLYPMWILLWRLLGTLLKRLLLCWMEYWLMFHPQSNTSSYAYRFILSAVYQGHLHICLTQDHALLLSGILKSLFFSRAYLPR